MALGAPDTFFCPKIPWTLQRCCALILWMRLIIPAPQLILVQPITVHQNVKVNEKQGGISWIHMPFSSFFFCPLVLECLSLTLFLVGIKMLKSL